MNRKFRYNYLIIVSIFTITINNVSAQDTHYWNLQYGTSSTLLGGVVIGSVRDMAATYYNPAALALFPAPEILLSGKVYQYSALSVSNGVEEGKTLTSSTIEPAPALFAGSFTFDWLGDNTLSYSILTRTRMNFGIEGRRGGVYGEDSEEEFIAGELIANQELSDIWVGLTWAVKLSPKIAFGVTPYLSIRDQKTRKHAYTEVLDMAGNVSATILTQQFEYKNYRLLAKAGFGANFDPLTMGVTITTPTLSLSGTGSSLVNIVNTGDAANEETFYLANYQQEVAARHNIPLAIGFGAGYKLGEHRIHFSTEWYDAVARYDIMDTQSFTAQSDGEEYLNLVDSELKSIINYGFGVEFYLEEYLKLYVGYATDFSASIPDTETNLTVSTWDIYHISGGASFRIGGSEITAGVSYAFGSEKLKGPVKVPEGEIQSELVDFLENSDMDYTRLKALIGFSFQI